jgi:hypothetical protein
MPIIITSDYLTVMNITGVASESVTVPQPSGLGKWLQTKLN